MKIVKMQKNNQMQLLQKVKVAWLLPSLDRAFYWQPVFREFVKRFPRTVVLTGKWPGFLRKYINTFEVRVVGRLRRITFKQTGAGYSRGFLLPSPRILWHLICLSPNVIFATSFNLWSLISLFFKLFKQCQVVIIYEGSSPTVDYLNSRWRICLRRFMARFADAFITNSKQGQIYLSHNLGIDNSHIFQRPFEVPDLETLIMTEHGFGKLLKEYRRPVFLFIGQLIHRKGIRQLLESCYLLNKEGIKEFSLVIIGDGDQKRELENFVTLSGLSNDVHWTGWVGYEEIGGYMQNADIFVFPTFEDTWGMVVLEAMAFGKPVLCSEYAGASEMVCHGENGFIFNPYQPDELACLMLKFIKNPNLLKQMGDKSREIMLPYNPRSASKFLGEVVSFVMKTKKHGNV